MNQITTTRKIIKEAMRIGGKRNYAGMPIER